VSKERAKRRAERETVRAAAEAVRARRQRRAVLRRLRPPDRRRAWLLARRSPGQRAAVIGVGLGLLAAIWYLTESWPTRIGLSLLALLALPVLVIVTFDRRKA
jgi:Flp pilus assembly protein TadB